MLERGGDVEGSPGDVGGPPAMKPLHLAALGGHLEAGIGNLKYQHFTF